MAKLVPTGGHSIEPLHRQQDRNAWAVCAHRLSNQLSFLVRKRSPRGGTRRLAQSHRSKMAERWPVNAFLTPPHPAACFHLPKHTDRDTCSLAEERLSSRWGPTVLHVPHFQRGSGGGQSLVPLEAHCQLSLPLEPELCLDLPSLSCCWVCLPFLGLNLELLQPQVFTKDLPAQIHIQRH